LMSFKPARFHYVRRNGACPFGLRLSDENSFEDVNTHNCHINWNGSAVHNGDIARGIIDSYHEVERALLAAFVLRWSPAGSKAIFDEVRCWREADIHPDDEVPNSANRVVLIARRSLPISPMNGHL